jgi:glycerol kinase
MSERMILVIDEGTTSTRAMLIAADGRVVAVQGHALDQHYPRPGWVEHDAEQIWQRTLACARGVIEQAGGVDRIAAIGITNQRETVVAWDRATGRPLAPAIVWQDRRTAAMCEAMKADGHEVEVQRRTGLLLDPYFSATKMRWLLDHAPAVAAAAAGDRLAFGTIDSWLLWNLTGGLHASDASNASRTMLMALAGRGWDDGLADLFGVPLSALPAIVDTHGDLAVTDAGLFGAAIPICAMVGDQQGATIGQACLSTGDTKATLGTGAFILTNSGDAPPHSQHRLLSTVLWQQRGARTYALEGSIFVAGSAVQWLRDRLGIIASATETEELARSVPDNGGVSFVPALSGLGAPYWDAGARGVIAGLTLGAGRAHIVRATLEAMAHQCHDLAGAFRSDGVAWDVLRIDGGMAANDWVAQDLADILDVPVERPADVETTALGAAMLAAVGAGLYPDLAAAAAAMRPPVTRFAPAMAPSVRAARLADWSRALSAARS